MLFYQIKITNLHFIVNNMIIIDIKKNGKDIIRYQIKDSLQDKVIKAITKEIK